MGIIGKILRYQKEYGTKYTIRKVYYRYQIKYRLGKKYYPLEISDSVRREQQNWIPERPVKISIVVPLYNTDEIFLREMIESVQNQTYSDWELCLADASDRIQVKMSQIVSHYSDADSRIIYRKLASNEGISDNTNQGITMSTGQYIALLDHDDLLHPSALYYVMQEIQGYGADFVYTDELSFDRKPDRVQSIHLKPDYSQESFRNNNYICHLSIFSRKLLERAGMFRRDFDGSQDYDMILRLTDCAECIRHVSRILYYWRCHPGSVASAVGAKPYTIEAGRKALKEHLRRRGLSAQILASEEFGPFYKIDYKIPENLRILMIAEDKTQYDKLIQRQEDIPWSVDIRLSGENTHYGENDVVILLRSGYEPGTEDMNWLKELLSCLVPPENMTAAPVVYSPSGKVLHAGYCYDFAYPDLIRPLYRNVPKADPAYMNRLAFRQNVSLLGGAVLAVKAPVFQKYIDGKGKESLFSDMAWFSLCIIAKQRYGDNVITPNTYFIADDIREQEKDWEAFRSKWFSTLTKKDPHNNPGMNIFGKYYFLW